MAHRGPCSATRIPVGTIIARTATWLRSRSLRIADIVRVAAPVNRTSALPEQLRPVMFVSRRLLEGVTHAHAVVRRVHHVGAMAVGAFPLSQSVGRVCVAGCDILGEGAEALSG